jgi:hypothetical protein
MRSVLRRIFKLILGAVLGALFFLGLGSVKGFLDGLPLIGMSPMYILTGMLWLGPWYASWLGGDLILLSAFLGLAIAILKQFRQGVFGEFSLEPVQKTFKLTSLILAVIIVFWISIKTQNIVQVHSKYFAFCASVRKGDYLSAYTYFSEEYRNTISLDQFIQDKLQPGFPYVTGCNSMTVKFASSFGNNASILPYETYQSALTTSFAMFPREPELFMEKINGEWYFTGQEIWYVD